MTNEDRESLADLLISPSPGRARDPGLFASADGMAIADISEGEWLRQDTLKWFWEGALTDVEPIIVYPPPTPEQIIERNFAVQQRLRAEANTAITPLQYAVDLELEREAEAEQLKLWKRYVVEVSRVDLAQIEPDWPAQPESDPARLGGLFIGVGKVHGGL